MPMLRCPLDNLPCQSTGCSFRGCLNELCGKRPHEFRDHAGIPIIVSEEKKNTMENMNGNIIKTKEMVIRRTAIAEKYCIEKGWPTDPGELTFDQIFEIRALDEWKNVPDDIDKESAMKEPTSSGSVAAPKEEFSEVEKLEMQVRGTKRFNEIQQIEINNLKSELASLRQQLEQKTIALDSYYKLAAEVAPLKEALKELLPIAEKGLNVAIQILEYLPNDADRKYEVEEIKAIIERACKLLSK